jgi:hypothetical protein
MSQYTTKVAYKSFENVADFKYLGTILTNQNYPTFASTVRADLISGMLANILSPVYSCKYYNTVGLPVVSSGCETRSFTLGLI